MRATASDLTESRLAVEQVEIKRFGVVVLEERDTPATFLPLHHYMAALVYDVPAIEIMTPSRFLCHSL